MPQLWIPTSLRIETTKMAQTLAKIHTCPSSEENIFRENPIVENVYRFKTPLSESCVCWKWKSPLKKEGLCVANAQVGDCGTFKKRKKGKQLSKPPSVLSVNKQTLGMQASTVRAVCTHHSRKRKRDNISEPKPPSFSYTYIYGWYLTSSSTFLLLLLPVGLMPTSPVSWEPLLLLRCTYIWIAWVSPKMQVLIEEVWVGAKDAAFLTSPSWYSCFLPILWEEGWLSKS